MSIKALSEYTIYAKYARYVPDNKRRESWDEMVTRVFDMHTKRYENFISGNKELLEEINFAKLQVKKKRVLGAQRILQFGGDPIFKHNAKVFNCSFGYIDRIAAFQESMYLLLCGCGVGFSVQYKHTNKLPSIGIIAKSEKVFKPEDSIEGWADCVGVLMSSYFTGKVPFPEYQGHRVKFDFSNIRPEGALIAGQFKAPGHKGLEAALEKVVSVFEKFTFTKRML
jgi:ribonucleoside-diphosphate reductase alpha chain